MAAKRFLAKKHTERLYNLIFPLVVLAAIIAIWAVAAANINEEFILPKVSTTFKEFGNLFKDKQFYISFGATLLRTLLAFLSSFLIAALFATLSHFIAVIGKVFRPIVAVMRSLPTVSVILWLLLWLQSDIVAAVVTGLVIFPTLYSGFSQTLGEIDGELIDMLKIYKVPRKKIISKFILPVTFPSVLFAFGNGFALNLKLMVSSEVLASTAKSLGFMLNESKIYYMTARLMALTLVTVFTALLIEMIFSSISKAISVRWKK